MNTPFLKTFDDSLPSRKDIANLQQSLMQLLFPRNAKQIESLIDAIRAQLNQISDDPIMGGVHKPTENLFDKFSHIQNEVIRDAEAVMTSDPAASSLEEVIRYYPGIQAIGTYRIAHALYEMNVPVLPRALTEAAHSQTGIDIHPEARIGRSFFIDHGTGIVIGQTAEIGNDVSIYQGVTLGALSFRQDENGNVIKEHKRHPTIQDRVTIYANATILGGKTVIGHDSIIGGSSFITASIDAYTKVWMDHEPIKKSRTSNPETR